MTSFKVRSNLKDYMLQFTEVAPNAWNLLNQYQIMELLDETPDDLEEDLYKTRVFEILPPIVTDKRDDNQRYHSFVYAIFAIIVAIDVLPEMYPNNMPRIDTERLYKLERYLVSNFKKNAIKHGLPVNRFESGIYSIALYVDRQIKSKHLKQAERDLLTQTFNRLGMPSLFK